jgi:hypothetical protein
LFTTLVSEALAYVKARNLLDFHLEITNNFSGRAITSTPSATNATTLRPSADYDKLFGQPEDGYTAVDHGDVRVDIYYMRDGLQRSLTPREECISCELQNPVSRVCLLCETSSNRVWMDAKARPMFVITPLLHHESLYTLDPDALFALFADSLMVLANTAAIPRRSRILEAPQAAVTATTEESKTEMEASLAALTPVRLTRRIDDKVALLNCKFRKIVVNEGNYRNLSHLHAKVTVAKKEYAAFCKLHWSEDRNALLLKFANDRKTFRAVIGGHYKPRKSLL